MSVAPSSGGAPPPLPGAGDTIAAIATPRGRGALAVIRMSGPEAREIAERVLRPWRDVPRESWLGALHEPGGGELVDRGMVTVFHGPASYTGEDAVEITLHGGHLVPALALSALLRAGARQALPGEFTRRAVLAGRMDMLQAEAVGDLIEAGSRAMHRAAIRQLEGSLSRRLGELRESILDLEAMIAYEIDFPEEDEGPVRPERMNERTDRVIQALDALLSTAGTGEMIREGAVVVIAGPPNVGKSSLFNALVGSVRAIVTAVPGTTRDALEAVIEVEGWPVRLVDTAGLRPSADVVERLGIEVSERWLGEADLVLACAEEPSELEGVAARVRTHAEAPVVPVLTKADLLPSGYQGHNGEVLVVSAATGVGLGELGQAIAKVLADTNVDPAGEAPVLLRERHRNAVARARDEVARFAQFRAADEGPATIGAVHLRTAAAELEGLVGAIDVEDVLDRVFSSFCIGK